MESVITYKAVADIYVTELKVCRKGLADFIQHICITSC